MSNIQVTHDTSLDNARSESSLVINPNNTQQIVAGSKKFINYHTYDFTLATAYSTDGGQTWGKPKLIHTDDHDDKQWAAGDGNPGSPFHGRVYAAWDGPGGLCFARTLDHGNTWIGTGTSPAGTAIAPSS